jgi:ATP-dependent Clp protease ATP-binding subunit ClpC
MFERYTESARRALFYSRYEASELGRRSIETEHLLLGLLRAGKGVTSRLFTDARVSYEPVRGTLETGAGEKIPTSVEIPFSEETKRILDHTVEEADQLRHSYIGTEHLLLGLLQEDQSIAGVILSGYGMRLEAVREHLVILLNESTALPVPGRPKLGVGLPSEGGHESNDLDWMDRANRIERIKHLVERLEHAKPGSGEAVELIKVIRQVLDTL